MRIWVSFENLDIILEGWEVSDIALPIASFIYYSIRFISFKS